MKDKPKIALLKQEVYQDLYVCPVTEKDPEAILLSSMVCSTWELISVCLTGVWM